MDDYKTVYTRDYIPKSVLTVRFPPQKQQFKDPVGEGFKNYLELDDRVDPAELLKENVGDYFIKFKEQYPRLAAKHFKTPLDIKDVEEEGLVRGITVYQKDYCKKKINALLDASFSSHITLPDDTQLPSTTYLSSFRNPESLDSKAFAPRSNYKPISSLGTEKKVKEILGIVTGETTYHDHFSELGGNIIKDQIPEPEVFFQAPSLGGAENVGHGDMCPCQCKHGAAPGFLGPNVYAQDQWQRLAPSAALLDPKLYPARVGAAPEVDTMRFNQPNVFLEKLKKKYPFLYEVLRTAPPDDIIGRINRDRLRTTYQVDFCHLNEYPSAPYDDLIRASGLSGASPCAEPVRLPGDPCRPNQKPIAFRPSTISNSKKTDGFGGALRGGDKCGNEGGGGGGGGGGSGGGGAGAAGSMTMGVSGATEYQDAISKLGELIIRDKIHYPRKKKSSY